MGRALPEPESGNTDSKLRPLALASDQSRRERMRTAGKVIFLVNDEIGAAISSSLQPSPNSSLQRSEAVFNLSLDRYGIKHQSSSGQIVNFIDDQGCPQVSIVLMENYEPPAAVCAVNEVLASIMAQGFSTAPTFLIPIIMTETKLNLEMRDFALVDDKSSLYGAQLGPGTDLTECVINGIQKLPLSFQVSSEPLACLLQLGRVFNLPFVVLAGSSGQHKPDKIIDQELQALINVGEYLATCCGLFFSKDMTRLISTRKSKSIQEPWRALYG